MLRDIGSGPIIIGAFSETKADVSKVVTSCATSSEAKSKMPLTKYTQPEWCPSGLTKAQKRRLQRARSKLAAEEQRDKIFEEIKPRHTMKKIWKIKDPAASPKPEVPVYPEKMGILLLMFLTPRRLFLLLPLLQKHIWTTIWRLWTMNRRRCITVWILMSFSFRLIIP